MRDFLTTLLLGSIETGGQPELVWGLSPGAIPGRDVCFLSLSYQDKTWGPRYETIDFTTLTNPIYPIYFRRKHPHHSRHLTVLRKDKVENPRHSVDGSETTTSAHTDLVAEAHLTREN